MSDLPCGSFFIDCLLFYWTLQLFRIIFAIQIHTYFSDDNSQETMILFQYKMTTEFQFGIH